MRTAFQYFLALTFAGAASIATSAPLGGQSHLARVQALGLDSLRRDGVVAYYSAGRSARAQHLAAAMVDMMAYYRSVRGWDVQPRLAVLSQADWEQTIENPYGVPAMRQPGPIAFLPADVNSGAVFNDLVARARLLPPAERSSVLARCGSLDKCAGDGADAITFHELAHMYQQPARIGSPSYWFNEFVAGYITYAYLRAREPPQAAAFLAINQLASDHAPQFLTIEDFEREIEKALPPEYGRLQRAFTARIIAVYERQGLMFLDSLASAFPLSRHPFGCGEAPSLMPTDSAAPMSRSWTGLCDTSVLSTKAIMERLEAIEPGFILWAQRFKDMRE